MLTGFDIGGTKTEVCLLSNQGEELFKHRVATPKQYDEFLRTVTELVTMADNHAGARPPVGIGLPGTICPQTGLMKNANATFLNGRDLLNDLKAALNRDVLIANDANCFALSEAVDGGGKDGAVVFGAILGTGCGGGIVVNKQALVGPNAVCGEWGHNPLPGYSEETDGPARPCYCGRNNCIERFISGSGLQESYKVAYGTEKPAADIIRDAQAGKSEDSRIYHAMIDQMARSFASIVNVLDPDVIVLGGGLSNVDSLYHDLPDATAKYVFSEQAQVRFEKARFGDSSGIRGAAWLGRNTTG